MSANPAPAIREDLTAIQKMHHAAKHFRALADKMAEMAGQQQKETDQAEEVEGFKRDELEEVVRNLELELAGQPDVDALGEELRDVQRGIRTLDEVLDANGYLFV